jgi:polo-like kinase 1
LFRLSNRTIQVNFTDGSEILLSSEAQACVFVNKKTKRRSAHLLAKLPADPELLRRLRYVKEVLHQLVHRA